MHERISREWWIALSMSLPNRHTQLRKRTVKAGGEWKHFITKNNSLNLTRTPSRTLTHTPEHLKRPFLYQPSISWLLKSLCSIVGHFDVPLCFVHPRPGLWRHHLLSRVLQGPSQHKRMKMLFPSDGLLIHWRAKEMTFKGDFNLKITRLCMSR